MKRNPNHFLQLTAILMLSCLQAQAGSPVRMTGALLNESGVIITLILLALPIMTAALLIVAKASKLLKNNNEIPQSLSIENISLAKPDNRPSVIQNMAEVKLPFAVRKRSELPLQVHHAEESRVILWYLISATFWLILGTSIGLYLGVKFLAPEIDQFSWLSFGRLRPVHTNVVFWGWASMGMIGLGYYVIHTVSQSAIASIKLAWYGIYFINAAVAIGTISLMAGINNGGGEYREYTWPIMFLLGLGFLCTLANFYLMVAKRKSREIYISGWYIISALIFISIVVIAAYLPFWQNGLGETILQGYYMHQAVGMWFMFFSLGIIYYFLPQQLNKPIYSYSLGILAFWTQILFYTLIGTHHFVFSAIPWWLQTVAIVASAGMIIPVAAGTTNFLLTFKGAWHRLRDSYVLPFFVVGIVFYFTGSLQGTAEAFRYTNLLWHFTDFTVAHSHITMYGIITFLLWGGIYALVPRLTGKEAPQLLVGAHFWFAFIGLLCYTIPLMYGGTLRGLSWMSGAVFIESIKLMMPYWLWRAIGGTLMWISHLLFGANLLYMLRDCSVHLFTSNSSGHELVQ